MTDLDISELRRQKWHLDGQPVRILADARAFLESTGFCLMYPQKPPVLAPTFIGAWVGADDRLPAWQQAFADPRAQDATELMVRLLRERDAYEANLFGENNPLLISGSIFAYFYALVGERNPKQAPKAGPRAEYSELACDAFAAIQRGGPISKAKLQEVLGGSISTAALDHALAQLGAKLRITRVDYNSSEGSFWDVLYRWSPDVVHEGIEISVATAITALTSKYIDCVVAADQNDLDSFLGSFAPRTRVREAVNALLAMREIEFVPVGSRTLIRMIPPKAEFVKSEVVKPEFKKKEFVPPRFRRPEVRKFEFKKSAIIEDGVPPPAPEASAATLPGLEQQIGVAAAAPEQIESEPPKPELPEVGQFEANQSGTDQPLVIQSEAHPLTMSQPEGHPPANKEPEPKRSDSPGAEPKRTAIKKPEFKKSEFQKSQFQKPGFKKHGSGRPEFKKSGFKPRFAKRGFARPAPGRSDHGTSGSEKFGSGGRSISKTGGQRPEFQRSSSEKTKPGNPGRPEFRSSDAKHSSFKPRRDFKPRDFGKSYSKNSEFQRTDFKKPKFEKFASQKPDFKNSGSRRSASENPKFERRDFVKPGAGPPDFGKPGFAKPGFGKPRFEKSQFGKPKFDKPGFRKPDFKKFAFKKPEYDKTEPGKSDSEKPRPHSQSGRPELKEVAAQTTGFKKFEFKKSNFKRDNSGKSAFGKPKFAKSGFKKSGFKKSGSKNRSSGGAKPGSSPSASFGSRPRRGPRPPKRG